MKFVIITRTFVRSLHEELGKRHVAILLVVDLVIFLGAIGVQFARDLVNQLLDHFGGERAAGTSVLQHERFRVLPIGLHADLLSTPIEVNRLVTHCDAGRVPRQMSDLVQGRLRDSCILAREPHQVVEPLK